MQRRRSDAGEAWIVTFADLMTLLFCFFVLLTTLSTQPKNCTALGNYLEENRAQFQNYELYSTKLECIVALPSDFLFRSGSDVIQKRAMRDLVPLFRTIRTMPEHESDLVIVEGHTDNVPIKTRRFANNWELSSARATNIATFLVNSMKYPGENVSTRAFAENRPRVSYIDEFNAPLRGRELREARIKNRRVEIILTRKPKDLKSTKMIFEGKD